jgi:hypothetical protein
MYWDTGWRQRSAAETRTLALTAIERDLWIFEGNNSDTMQERLGRADMVVFLDISTSKRLWRTVFRALRYYGRSRPDMAEGCPERFNWAFLKFVAGYANNGRLRALNFLDNVPEGKKVYHLGNNHDVRSFLDDALNATS